MHESDGFIINEEGRQHINLSSEAMMTIEGDMIKFNDDYELKNKSGFINTIITNYYDAFPISPDKVLKQLGLLQGALDKDDLGKSVVNAVVTKFSKEMMRSAIREYSNRYLNEIKFKLKLNKDNVDMLRRLEEAKYFNEYAPRSGIAFYIKILLESYAVLKREERERIYFKETIDKIERAINRKSLIRYKDGNSYRKVTPMYIYKPFDQHSLAVVVIYNSGITDAEFASVAIKIKYLTKRDVKDLMKKNRDHKMLLSNLSVNKTRGLMKELEANSKKPTEVFTIRFTKLGLERYIFEEDSIPLVGIRDLSDKLLYTFKTTETKIFHHLFKFGAQAQIVSPLSARERFMKLYKVSYETYKRDNRIGGE